MTALDLSVKKFFIDSDFNIFDKTERVEISKSINLSVSIKNRIFFLRLENLTTSIDFELNRVAVYDWSPLQITRSKKNSYTLEQMRRTFESSSKTQRTCQQNQSNVNYGFNK